MMEILTAFAKNLVEGKERWREELLESKERAQRELRRDGKQPRSALSGRPAAPRGCQARPGPRSNLLRACCPGHHPRLRSKPSCGSSRRHFLQPEGGMSDPLGQKMKKGRRRRMEEALRVQVANKITRSVASHLARLNRQWQQQRLFYSALSQLPNSSLPRRHMASGPRMFPSRFGSFRPRLKHPSKPARRDRGETVIRATKLRKSKKDLKKTEERTSWSVKEETGSPVTMVQKEREEKKLMDYVMQLHHQLSADVDRKMEDQKLLTKPPVAKRKDDNMLKVKKEEEKARVKKDDDKTKLKKDDDKKVKKEEDKLKIRKEEDRNVKKKSDQEEVKKFVKTDERKKRRKKKLKKEKLEKEESLLSLVGLSEPKLKKKKKKKKMEVKSSLDKPTVPRKPSGSKYGGPVLLPSYKP